MPGHRLGSFTGKESVIGNYFCGFSLIFLSYLYKTFYNKKYLNLLCAVLLIIISFIIGERANFIKTFIIITLFYFFIYDFKIKNKIYLFLISSLLLLVIINYNSHYKFRYYEQIKTNFKKGGISTYLDNSIYGAHYSVAVAIFIMMITKTIHPPAGGNPLIVILGSKSLFFILMPLALSSIMIIIFAILYNRSVGRKYPFK